MVVPRDSSTAGSPPLARGTLSEGDARTVEKRLTPARAGNTRYAHAHAAAYPAHPRSRGEHEMAEMLICVPFGSPPLARGTRIMYLAKPDSARLTPARAGNTMSAPVLCVNFSAHPRSRGEHRRVLSTVTSSLGSPPLARGTLGIEDRRDDAVRLTPARAGNTPFTFQLIILSEAHPRSRGEHC